MAVIIGEKSFGKGLVQLSRPLPDHAQVKITIAKYYTPTGRCIQVLDYAHRRADGSAGAIVDSLKKEFKTTRGRIVYDGGGIDPDLKMPAAEAATVTQVLYNKGFIFDYATYYTTQHTTLSNAKTFMLSQQEYGEFIQWMKGKNYYYQSHVQSELDAIEKEAKKEKQYINLKPQLDALQSKLKENRKNDLYLYEDQIKTLLEEEIASRFYLEKGAVEARLKYDQEIKKAIEVMRNKPEYKKILNLN